MVRNIRQWFNRYFSDPEAILLIVILALSFGLVILLGNILAPVLVGIVFAYLLEGPVRHLQRFNIPRLPAVLIVFVGFLTVFFLAFFVLLPLVWHQLSNLFNDLPDMLISGQNALFNWANQYPEYVTSTQVQDTLNSVVADARDWGKTAISASLALIPSVITWVVYLVLMPLLLFFFLKDRDRLLTWLASFLPPKRGLLRRVSKEVNIQIGNYIRGKVVEIIIVFLATYFVFWLFDLRYAVLLAFLVGFSVLIPYVGVVVVSIPVALVAYLQWGFDSQFGYLLLAYFVVQGLDANLLVPLLFSEAVNLHPVAIIVATLFFGGIWGFWGVFFAIPLATLVKAVIYAWPKPPHSKAA